MKAKIKLIAHHLHNNKIKEINLNLDKINRKYKMKLRKRNKVQM